MEASWKQNKSSPLCRQLCEVDGTAMTFHAVPSEPVLATFLAYVVSFTFPTRNMP